MAVWNKKSIPPPPYQEMGLEMILKNRQLQELWLNRFVAYIIDVVIVGIAVSLILLFFAIPFFLIDFFTHGLRMEFWPPLSAFSGLISVISLFYFAFMETYRGSTIGKSALGLKVIADKDERLSLDKAFLRNISKLHWALLLLDILIGLGTKGDPKQKFSDRYVGTLVIKSEI